MRTRDVMWRFAVVVLVVVAAGCSQIERQAESPPSAAPPAGFVQKTLDNGLTILCLENRTAPIAQVQVFVRTGSMFEDEFIGSGISHFCEHLVSGGTTTTRTEAETKKILLALGGANNAYTSSDDTSYFIRTTKGENFKTACALLADWMQNAAITQEEFDREKQVIQREIEKGEVEPNRVLWKLATQTTFSYHPVRHPVIGRKDIFLRLTRDDVVKYYRRKYAPDNMVVVAVGDFDAAETAEHIAGLFKDAKPSGRLISVPPEDPPQQGTRRGEAELDVKAAYVLIGFRTVPLSHPDLYPLDVMAYVLGNGDSSRLVQRLREKERLVESVSCWSDTPWYGAGRLLVFMTLKPENIEKAEAAVIDELNRLTRDLVSEAELARAQKQKAADEVFSKQTIQARVSDLGGNFIGTGNPFFGEVYLRGIRAVTAGQIRDAARRYIHSDNLTVAVIRPKGEKKAHTAAAATPEAKTEKVVLPNGLRVLIRPNKAAPLVSIQAYFLGGLLQEDDATAGTSRVLAEMLTRGTKTRSALDIATAFDEMGGSISGGSGNNTVFLKADVLAEDFARAFAIFADCIRNPSLPEDELAKAKALAIEAIARQDDDWDDEANNLLRRTLYKVSPYRLNPLGTAESVKAITVKSLAEFHAKTCVARNGVLAIYGDIDAEQAKRLAAQLLGSLPAGGAASATSPPKDPPLEEDINVTKESDRPDTAVIAAAYPACTLTDLADRYALLILDGVMSGIGWPSGWLHDELRGKGLVYLVHGYNFLGFRTPGYFGITALTQPQKLDEALRIIDNSVERAKSGLVSEEEFERTKQMAITLEQLERQTNSAVAAGAALDELYGLGYDFGDRFAEQVKAVTREDVLRVAKKYLTKRALVIIRPPEKKAAGEK